MTEESQERYFLFAKANPLVELDDKRDVVPTILPISSNTNPIAIFVREPFFP